MNEQLSSEQIRLDIDAVVRAKLGKRARYVPRPLLSWLKKTAHQDDLNEYLTTRCVGKEGMEWLDECVDYLEMHLHTEGLENLPDNSDGRYFTFVSNHPLGGIDGVALGSILCHKYDSRIRYLVNDLLMNLKGLAPLCVPINKTGSQSRDFPRLVDATFASENNVLMFPAGLCSRKRKDGEIHDLPWKKTFITKSVEYKRDVIPVHFSGRNSEKFYNIANWCSRLRLKVNVAMLYLVDEMYRNVGKDFYITFGKPIPWQTFDKSKSASEWALWVEDEVYRLKVKD